MEDGRDVKERDRTVARKGFVRGGRCRARSLVEGEAEEEEEEVRIVLLDEEYKISMINQSRLGDDMS